MNDDLINRLLILLKNLSNSGDFFDHAIELDGIQNDPFTSGYEFKERIDSTIEELELVLKINTQKRVNN